MDQKRKINLLAAAIASLSLAGCGGGGGSQASMSTPGGGGQTATTSSVSGLAIDGYLSNAEVCLDVNLNGQCDSSEPSTFTSTNGGYLITGVPQSEASTAPVLLIAKAGVTVDQDTGNPVSSSYSMYAPAGYHVVSPITSLVAQSAMAQGIIASGKSGGLSSVESNIAQAVFGTTSRTGLIQSDYVSIKNSTTASSSSKTAAVTEDALARHIADIVAAVLSNTSVTVSQAASQKSLINAAYSRVANNLSTIRAIPDNATEAEVMADTTSLRTGLTQQDVANEQSIMPVPVPAPFAGLSSQSNYWSLTPQLIVGSATQVDMRAAKFVANMSSSVNGGLVGYSEFYQGAHNSTPAQWAPDTSGVMTYYYNAGSSSLVFGGMKRSPSINNIVSGTNSGVIGGIPVSLSLLSVKLDGLDVAKVESRIDDLTSLPNTRAQGVITTFPSGSYLYYLKADATQNTFVTYGSGNLAPSTLQSSQATLPNGVTGTIYGSLSMSSSSGLLYSFILGNDGGIYVASTSSGTPSASVKIGTYTTVAAQGNVPKHIALTYPATWSLAYSNLAPEYPSFSQVVIFTDSSGVTRLGAIIPVGGKVYSATLLNNTAEKTVIGAINDSFTVTSTP